MTNGEVKGATPPAPPHLNEHSCMPRIDDSYLECVIYLYPDVPSAQSGGSYGGSGFLVFIPSKVKPELGQLYAVTNSHVIREGHSPVIRFNTKEGDFAIGLTTEAEWTHHPDGDDIAVRGLSSLDIVSYRFVSIQDFIAPEIIQKQDIGPGDDVFMVGRLINHEGRQRNTPSVRFGNISMMPFEPLLSSRGIMQESFVVEMRSIPGYSGSPAFVYIPAMVSRPASRGISNRGFGPMLLGIDSGHLPLLHPVLEDDRVTPVKEGWVVNATTGMASIIPAWKIKECLEVPELASRREALDRGLAAGQSHEVVQDTLTSGEAPCCEEDWKSKAS